MFVTNGQNCLVQEFNADPTSNYKNVAFLTNFNQANLDAGSDCGTPGQLGADGQFEDGARGITIDGTARCGSAIWPTSVPKSSMRTATG